MEAPAAPPDDSAAPPDAIAAARLALEQSGRVFSAVLALLRVELKLARSSALTVIGLGFALIFLGITAWFATNAAIAAGVYQLTGNVFYGIGVMAISNLAGVVVVLFAMRTCWRDMAMPRTRRMIRGLSEKPDEARDVGPAL